MTKEQASELHALSSAVLALNQHLDVREVLRMVVSSARALLGARYAALGVPDDHGAFAEFVAVGVSDAQWQAIGPLPRQHGLLGVMLQDPHPQRLADIRAHPRFAGWPRAHPALKDFLGMPIVSDDEIVGAIYLANKTAPGGFTADDEELLAVFAAHAAIALTNARLYERNHELSVVEERHRLAQELHDAVSQKLFSLRLSASAVATLVGTDPGRARDELNRVQELASEALGELRSVIWELRPAELADDGFVAVLKQHVQVLDRIHDPEVLWRARCVPHLDDDRAAVVVRIAQEALHNALRHAQPKRVTVTLSCRVGGGALLEVADDGSGFDVTEVERTSRRLGLGSMRDRARDAGGELTIASSPGRGTTVRLELPEEHRS
ncbi:MAG: GAF domain-containing sensor histidine kinase [Acidothermales bacterium]|nr:GAF domain-containing sensor histidine kinase [Acidothermales bacterium]